MPQPARVKFITKRGDWVTEACHDILTCREHKVALDRTRKVLNASDKNIITNLLPEEVPSDADSENSVSFEDYNRLPNDKSEYSDADTLSENVLATEGVPQYVLNSLSEIVYNMEDFTFINQDSTMEYSDEELDYDIDEPSLGDTYRHPELVVDNQDEIASMISHEFNMFGVAYGFKANVVTLESEDTWDHTAVKITGEDGQSWVADFSIRVYDESKPFPWIAPFGEWKNTARKIVREGSGLES